MPSSDEELRVLGALATGASLPELDEASWQGLADRAVVERLGPLVYWKQKKNPSLPARVADGLRRELYRSSAVNQIHFRELTSLLHAAASRGLPTPIVLKGAALAVTAYDDPALRPMSDVDLLVERDAFSDFVAAAESLGYVKAQPEMTRWIETHLRYHLALRKQDDETPKVELHWQIVAGDSDRRSPDIRWFHERVEPIVPGPTPANALAPSANLLHLAAHAALQHGLARSPLLWLHDIHLLVTRRGDALDWRAILDAAHRFGWREALFSALERSREVFETPLPAEAAKTEARRPETPVSGHAEWVWQELGHVRFRERLRWVLAILFPRPAFVKWRYPDAGRLWPTRYVYRWCAVGWQAARGVVARAMRRRRFGGRVDKRG